MAQAATGLRAASRRLTDSYPLTKARAHVSLRRRLDGTRPVLVHQMGKVASQAVAASLSRAGVPALQTHFVSSAGLARAEAVYRRAWDPQRGGPAHVWNGQWVRSRMVRGRDDGRWQVVTLVRDPVARNLSAFFQVADVQYGLDLAAAAAERSATEVAALVDELRERFLTTYDEHDLPLTWLDTELAAPFGVDVYATPFPSSEGHAQRSGERADVLVLRYEDLRRVFAPAVGQFLGRPGIELAQTNVSTAKGYGTAYDAMRRHLTLPADYLDRMYGSRYARHFYRADELAAMRARWEPRPEG